MKAVMIQVYEATKASIKGKSIKQCDIKCLQCGWTVLFTKSPLKFIIRLTQGAGGMAQWVKAYIADPELHPQDLRRVRREPMSANPSADLYTHLLLHTQHKGMFKKMFSKSMNEFMGPVRWLSEKGGLLASLTTWV